MSSPKEAVEAKDPKPKEEANRADELMSRGDYARALEHLALARKSATAPALVEELDLATGVALLRSGELDRAEPHLERVLALGRTRKEPILPRLLVALGELYRRRGDLDRADEVLTELVATASTPLTAELRARALTNQAGVRLEHGDLREASRLALGAVDAVPGNEPASCAARAEALLVLASVRARKHNWSDAERTCRQAITAAETAALPRELAEAYFAYAHVLGLAAGSLPGAGAPAAWLARAQDLYRDHGSLADLERVREAFRQLGRRATDQGAAAQIKESFEELAKARMALGREMARLLEAVERAAQRAGEGAAAASRPALEELVRSVGEAQRAVTASADAMSVAETRAFAATHVVISERENLQTLLDLSRLLNELREPEKILPEMARMAAQLTGADRAVVAELAGAQAEPLATWRIPADADQAVWREPIEAVLRGGGASFLGGAATTQRDGDALQRARALVAPLRVGESVLGAVYVDKELGGGTFTPHELDILRSFSAHAATTLANARANAELRREHSRPTEKK